MTKIRNMKVSTITKYISDFIKFGVKLYVLIGFRLLAFIGIVSLPLIYNFPATIEFTIMITAPITGMALLIWVLKPIEQVIQWGKPVYGTIGLFVFLAFITGTTVADYTFRYPGPMGENLALTTTFITVGFSLFHLIRQDLKK